MRFTWWVAAAVLVTATACSGDDHDDLADPTDSASEPALVYLSGLDDHFLPVRDTVPLHQEPAGAITGHAPVNVLAWVNDENGEWLNVTLADGEHDGESQRGWVADFYLRGRLHAVDPNAPGCPIPAWHDPDQRHRGQHHLDPSILVRPLDVKGHLVLVQNVATSELWWIDREVLSERPGPDVRRSSPGTACTDITGEPIAPHTH